MYSGGSKSLPFLAHSSSTSGQETTFYLRVAQSTAVLLTDWAVVVMTTERFSTLGV